MNTYLRQISGRRGCKAEMRRVRIQPPLSRPPTISSTHYLVHPLSRPPSNHTNSKKIPPEKPVFWLAEAVLPFDIAMTKLCCTSPAYSTRTATFVTSRAWNHPNLFTILLASRASHAAHLQNLSSVQKPSSLDAYWEDVNVTKSRCLVVAGFGDTCHPKFEFGSWL
jgi:hypothetical protein